MLRGGRRRLQRSTSVNMVPMIDVVFQLVVFFMLTSTFKVTPAIGLILPDSTTAEPTEMSRLVVAVHSDEVIYLNEEKLDLEGLREALAAEDGLEPGDVQSVIVESDREVSVALLVDVMDILRNSGFSTMALRTRGISQKVAP